MNNKLELFTELNNSVNFINIIDEKEDIKQDEKEDIKQDEKEDIKQDEKEDIKQERRY
jgi:hypothetical protein